MISSWWRVEIVFSSKRLQQQCATEAQRKRSFPHCASQLNRRLGQMEAADSLAVMGTLPGHCHELSGDFQGRLAVDVSGNYRLIFRSDHDELPTRSDGGLDWAQVTRIMILEVRDYHGH